MVKIGTLFGTGANNGDGQTDCRCFMDDKASSTGIMRDPNHRLGLGILVAGSVQAGLLFCKRMGGRLSLWNPAAEWLLLQPHEWSDSTCGRNNMA